MSLPIWQELLVGIEMTYLRLSPAYWGFGIPKGDGSGVVVIPAFLGTDLYLAEFRAWLGRIGYQPFRSCMGRNTDCPNLLIRLYLKETIEKAQRATGRKVHLIGHSLGGTIARSVAAQMPDHVASVISMAAPLRGVDVHSAVGRVVDVVRARIIKRHGPRVLPDCYTSECTCAFIQSLVTRVPESVRQTAIYTKSDGILDWHCCVTGDPAVDCEISATHIGLAFNPLAYELIANRLAAAHVPRNGTRKRRTA